MSSIENNLQCLLDGQPLAVGAVDISNEKAAKFVPLVKKNVCYIVCGLLINEQDEILMVQEAKESCYGQWYLPAGRMEPGETIQDAVKREVEEESGLTFDPSTLLAVESQDGTWYRFTLTGKVTGGHLKTTAEQDKESLQAKWYSMDEIQKELPLRSYWFLGERSDDQTYTLNKDNIQLGRCKDIFRLIDIAVKHHQSPPETRHADILPVLQPHKQMLLRIVIVRLIEDKLDMLVSASDPLHVPVSLINPKDFNLGLAQARFLQEVFGSLTFKGLTVCGVLTVEFCGKPQYEHDGMCLTLLVHATSQGYTRNDINGKYKWEEISNTDLKDRLKSRLNPDKNVTMEFL